MEPHASGIKTYSGKCDHPASNEPSGGPFCRLSIVAPPPRDEHVGNHSAQRTQWIREMTKVNSLNPQPKTS